MTKRIQRVVFTAGEQSFNLVLRQSWICFGTPLPLLFILNPEVKSDATNPVPVTIMKTNCLLVLGLVLSARLVAQQSTNPPAAEPPRVAVPLSKAALDKINSLTSLFDGKTLDGWQQHPPNSWIVKDGAMSSLGNARGCIYTKGEYGNFRLIFNMRHALAPNGKDHQPCFLIYCAVPAEGQKGLDTLNGIQFQAPNGGSWDYRVGKNNDGKGLFSRKPHPKFDNHEWFQVEILVNTNGTARMAVAQPPGTRAIEVLDFNDPTAGRKGPIAWQIHNSGLLEDYKDVRIEENPAQDKFITVE